VFSGNLFWQAGYNAVWMTLPTLHDTYRWHYQMGAFVQRYFSGTSLVVKDIGAVDFLYRTARRSPIKILGENNSAPQSNCGAGKKRSGAGRAVCFPLAVRQKLPAWGRPPGLVIGPGAKPY
jgi:hypothetical protein